MPASKDHAPQCNLIQSPRFERSQAHTLIQAQELQSQPGTAAAKQALGFNSPVSYRKQRECGVSVPALRVIPEILFAADQWDHPLGKSLATPEAAGCR